MRVFQEKACHFEGFRDSMSTSRGRGRASAPSGTSWRDRSSNGDSRSSAGGSGDVSAGRGGGSGGYRGRGGARSSTRGVRSAPASIPMERTRERSHHDAVAADDGKTPRDASATLGTCLQMCPRAEVVERTRTMEISRFEQLPPPGASASSREGGVLSPASPLTAAAAY